MIGLHIEVSPGYLELDKKHLKSVMRAGGNEIAQLARALIRKQAGGGRSYYARGSSGGVGRYTASAPGQSPDTLSGTLAKSIKVTLIKNGEGVSIRDLAGYALYLEAGSEGGGPGNKRTGSHRKGQYQKHGRRVLLPRPFLSLALDQRRPSIEQRIGAAIQTGMKFNKQAVPRK